jgi:hypothetical protein
METSPTLDKLAAALKDFQQSTDAVPKTATNPFFKSKYATLEGIIAHIQPDLGNAGLSYAQFPDADGLTTILMHTSGEWIKATMKVHMGAKPQDQGSALTYARRYALSGILGLATEDDDDGNAASAPKVAAAKTPPTPRPTEAEQRITAKKERIIHLLAVLGEPNDTKDEITEAVWRLTNLVLEESNFDAIGDALSKQAYNTDALK